MGRAVAPWRYAVGEVADLPGDNSGNVPALLDAVLIVHTTTSLVVQGDIHPDKACYFANRVTGTNVETCQSCCKRS